MFENNDDDEERTIKSVATKRQEAIDKIVEDTQKHAAISDFNALDDDFNRLESEIEKSMELSLYEGDKLPVKVLKLLMVIEDAVNTVSNEQKKKMSK